MPRDGTGNYNQPFPNVASDTTIESVVYNGFTNDVALDLNTARPIIAGGTGATSADAALEALKGERASQVVTNYNSHVWVPGSFYSTTSATGGPVDGHLFAGIVYMSDSANIIVEARDQNDVNVVPGRLYVREKKAGLWSSWKLDGRYISGASEGISSDVADMFFGFIGTAPNSLFSVNTESDVSGIDVLRVSKSGVTTFTPVSGALDIIFNGKVGFGNNLWGHKANQLRWILQLGNETAESGGNDGSIFNVNRYSDTGAYLGSPLQISRANGTVTLQNTLTVGGAVNVNGGSLNVNGNIVGGDLFSHRIANPTTGIVWLGNTGSRSLLWDGSRYSLAGNVPFHVNGPIYAHTSVIADFGLGFQIPSGLNSDGSTVGIRAANSVGAIYFTNYGAAQNYGYVNPGGFVSLTGSFQAFATPGNNAHFYMADEAGVAKGILYWLRASNTINLQGAATTTISLPPNGQVKVSNGIQSKDGFSGGYGTVCYNLAWQGGVGFHLYADDMHQGVIAYTSDYRTKKDVEELPRTWDIVKALRPIKYTQANYGPRARGDDGKEVANGPQLYIADDIERWGFVAHELQETMIPSAATAEKDAPKAIQAPNPWTIIAALTKTIQEMQERIEALEDA